MKQLQKSDLKEGEIYTSKLEFNPDNLFIWECSNNNELIYNFRLYVSNINAQNGNLSLTELSHSWDNIFEATSEEKHWLETCIKANKFVPYEEAMKTFIPEYVECIVGYIGMITESAKIGKIYKTSEKPEFSIYKWDYLFRNHSHRFKPSTKEAYDAQFIVKEPKVVLEEPKDKVLTLSSNYGKESIVKVECSEGGVYRIGDKIKVFDKYSPNKGKVFTIQSFRWTNDKSKICAVTELHTPNGIGLDKIELYIEPKVKQELSLLEQAKLRYPIGTKFKVACQPHVICTVLNHDTYHFQTSEICNLYVEEQNYGVNGATVYYKGKWAEIVDDFVLPENWYIKVTDDNKEVLQQYIRNIHDSTTITLSNINYIAYSKWLNGINQTENKLGYGLISKLNLNPLPNIYRTVTYYNGEEITFEQFKKYVLKDE